MSTINEAKNSSDELRLKLESELECTIADFEGLKLETFRKIEAKSAVIRTNNQKVRPLFIFAIILMERLHR